MSTDNIPSKERLQWLTRELVVSILREYRCQFQQYHEGGGMQLSDILTPRADRTVERGHEEMELLADHIAARIGEEALPDMTPTCCTCLRQGDSIAQINKRCSLHGYMKATPSETPAPPARYRWCGVGMQRVGWADGGEKYGPDNGDYILAGPAEKANNSCAYCEAGVPKVKEDLHYVEATNSSHRCASVKADEG